MTRTTAPVTAPMQRLVSLDVFRGLTMAAMVVVNDPGDWDHTYGPLLHAEWNGWTPTDLIFPFFLYMVGVSMTISRSTTGDWHRILRRTAMIIGLGWLLTLFPYFRFATWRLPGVLVRIGLCYLAAAVTYRATLPREASDRVHAIRLGLVAIGLMLFYWVAMVFMPFPGHAPGDLTPGGNLGAFIDRAVLTRSHMYRRGEFDPEGLFSTIPAIATTLLGILNGFWLRAQPERQVKAVMMMAVGAAAAALGLVWDLAFPINKALWTSSYVLFTGGAAALVFGACYWLLDVKGWQRWAKPFVILGMNAITLYALSALLAKILILVKWQDADGGRESLQGWIYAHWFVPLASPKNSSLLFALSFLAVLYVALWGMYRKRWFLRL